MTEKPEIPTAFVSYKSVNKEFAKRLAIDLRKAGVFAWLDDWNLPPGKPLTDAMEEGIESADVMLLLLSSDSMESIHEGTGGVAFEVHIGEGRKLEDSSFRIIGVYVEDCDPPAKLKNRIGKWIDFSREDDYEARLAELASWIRDPSADLGPPVTVAPLVEFRKLVRVSPDGRLVATTGRDGSITVLNEATKEPVITLQAGHPPVHDLHFSPGGRTLYATDEETAYEWDLEVGVLSSEFGG